MYCTTNGRWVYDLGMTTDEMTAKLRPLGMSNEHTECDRCGRMELRGTVIVVNQDGEEVGRYGTTCAGYVLGYKVTRQDAISTEAYRRSLIRDELHRAVKASKAGDMPSLRMYLDGARRIGAVRDDEISLIARLEGGATHA